MSICTLTLKGGDVEKKVLPVEIPECAFRDFDKSCLSRVLSTFGSAFAEALAEIFYAEEDGGSSGPGNEKL